MATDTPARPSNRPRPWLVIALGVVLAIYLALTFWPASPAVPAGAPPSRATAARGANGPIDPEDLKVKLEALNHSRPDPGEVDRNPFAFQPKAVPPANTAPPAFAPPANPVPQQPVGPPPPPPIPLKFIGIVEGGGVGKLAAFSDCKRTFYGREGDIVDGRYKLLKIGVESATMAYPDGRGQQTIRLGGQECIGK
jgi:hypothetical protein